MVVCKKFEIKIKIHHAFQTHLIHEVMKKCFPNSDILQYFFLTLQTPGKNGQSTFSKPNLTDWNQIFSIEYCIFFNTM